MPRASNGVYSLPSGNPVVTGTTIASTWANTTLSDVATAMTDSLDRSGFGGMLASLQLFSGTAGSPGLTWSVETNSGLYRAGAGDFRYSIAATDFLKMTSSSLLIGGTTAPGFSAVLGVMAAGGVNVSIHNTANSIEGIIGTTSTSTFVGAFTNHPFEIRTNNTQRINVTGNGNITINAPGTATTALVINVADATAAVIINSATTSSGYYMDFQRAGAGHGAIGFGSSLFTGGALADFGITSGTSGFLRLATNFGGTTVVTIAQAGNVVVNAPSSGTTVVMNGIANSNIFTITDGTVIGQWGTLTGSAGYLGTSSNHGFQIETNNTSRISIAAGGAVTIGAPSSSSTLTLTGPANVFTEVINASSTSGQSFGMQLNAGTTSADTALAVKNQSSSTTWLNVRGDGVVSGNDGTNLFELGYKDVPQNAQTANYTLALSDRGKSVQANTGTITTVTIPANASVAFPIGTAIVIINNLAGNLTIAITTDQLILAGTGTGGSGVSRTLASNGIATIYKVTATAWFVSGAGIS